MAGDSYVCFLFLAYLVGLNKIHSLVNTKYAYSAFYVDFFTESVCSDARGPI